MKLDPLHMVTTAANCAQVDPPCLRRDLAFRCHFGETVIALGKEKPRRSGAISFPVPRGRLLRGRMRIDRAVKPSHYDSKLCKRDSTGWAKESPTEAGLSFPSRMNLIRIPLDQLAGMWGAGASPSCAR
jgi:hypothetical protein